MEKDLEPRHIRRPIRLPPGIDAPEESIEAVLRGLGAGTTERVSFNELLANLDHRAYGFVLLLLAAPNLTPGPSLPGFSTILAVPAIAIAAQMVIGRYTPWLPPRLGRITIARRRFARLIARALPFIARMDRLLRPRLAGVWRIGGRRWTGLAALLQAVLLALPIPIYSMAPAFALVLMALGLIARDGLTLALGHLAGLVALGLAIALAVAANHLFG